MKDTKNKNVIDFYHLPDDELFEFSSKLPYDADEMLVDKIEKAIELKDVVRSQQSDIKKQIEKIKDKMKNTKDEEEKDLLKANLREL